MWKGIRSSENLEASVPAQYGACPPGYRIAKDRCFQCFPGSYTSGQDSRCFLCPKNFYMPKFASDSCWPCPDGRKTLKYGSDSQEQCILLDGSGGLSQSTYLIIVAACIIGSLIFIIAIAIGIHCLFLKDRKKKPPQKKVCPDLKALVPKRSADDHIYESLSFINSDDDSENIYETIDGNQEPIYENIQDNPDEDENYYMIPIKRKTSEPQYMELIHEGNLKPAHSDSELKHPGMDFKAKYYCLTDFSPEMHLSDSIGDVSNLENGELKSFLDDSRKELNSPSETSGDPSLLINFRDDNNDDKSSTSRNEEKLETKKKNHPIEKTEDTLVKNIEMTTSRIPRLKRTTLRSSYKNGPKVHVITRGKQFIKSESEPFKIIENTTIDIEESSQKVKAAQSAEYLKKFDKSRDPGRISRTITEAQNQNVLALSGYLDNTSIPDNEMNRSSSSSPIDTRSSTTEYCSTTSEPKFTSTDYSAPEMSPPHIAVALPIEPSYNATSPDSSFSYSHHGGPAILLQYTSITLPLKSPFSAPFSAPPPPPLPPPTPSLKFDTMIPMKPGDKSRLFY